MLHLSKEFLIGFRTISLAVVILFVGQMDIFLSQPAVMNFIVPVSSVFLVFAGMSFWLLTVDHSSSTGKVLKVLTACALISAFSLLFFHPSVLILVSAGALGAIVGSALAVVLASL